MRVNNEKMKRSQKMAIPYLISCRSYADAAREIGVEKSQVYEWLKDAEFKAELDRERDAVVDAAVGVIKSNTTKAAEALAELLDSPNDAIKRGVANDILGHVMKFKEIQELEKRIEALEKKRSK